MMNTIRFFPGRQYYRKHGLRNTIFSYILSAGEMLGDIY